jgi:hypothetical protein
LRATILDITVETPVFFQKCYVFSWKHAEKHARGILNKSEKCTREKVLQIYFYRLLFDRVTSPRRTASPCLPWIRIKDILGGANESPSFSEGHLVGPNVAFV